MDSAETAGFYERVYELVVKIPRGKVMSYGQIARALGSPRAARAVGYALRACDDPDLPWHRVVNAQGGISQRARERSVPIQRRRLENEGLRFEGGKLDMDRHRYYPEEPLW